MHARMNTSCTIQHGRHARLMCSQAAGRQWSSHAMDIYGSTSRGPLHVVVVHAVVQWLASLCRMCRPRTIARSTSLSACSARVERSTFASSLHSRASRGFRECSSASETDSGCNVAKVVAVGRSAAVVIRSSRSRQKVSVFRLILALQRISLGRGCEAAEPRASRDLRGGKAVKHR